MSQVGFVFLVLSNPCASSRSASAAILPSALFYERFFRSVQVGRSRFSRCCYLIIDLGFPAYARKLGRDLARSHLNSAVPLDDSNLLYATALATALWLRNGS
jgi:hypothetical protein